MKQQRERGARTGSRLVAVLSGLLIVASVIGGAAGKPNFAGTWKVDVERSSPTAGGGRYFNQDAALSEMVLVVTQTQDEVVVERHVGERVGRTVLKLDGTETSSEGPRGGRFAAKSRWDGDRLVTEGTQNRLGPNGEVTVEMTEVRELSPDGKTMIVTTTMKAPRATNTRKLVFVKVE